MKDNVVGDPFKKKKWWQNIDKALALLIVILLLGGLLRFWNFAFQGLWHDELCSVIRANPTLPVGNIIEIYQMDPHPPFHPLLLHFWMSLFGYHETSVLILAALAGIVGIYAIFLLGKAVAGKQGGLIAAAIIAFNYYHVYHSREVRPYIFAFLFSTLSFLFFLKLLKNQDKKNVILYAIFSTLLIYTHYYGLIMLVAHGTALLFYIIFTESFDRRQLFIHYGASGILILILYSPWIPTVLKMLERTKHWTSSPRDSFFKNYFNEYFGNNSYVVLLVGFLLLCLLVYIFLRAQGVLGEKSVEKKETLDAPELEKTVPILLFTIFFSLFIPYVRSKVTVPFLSSKYTIVTFALYIPLIAAAVTLFKEKLFKSFIIVTLILTSLFNLVGEKQFYTKITKQQWREVVRDVIANVPIESPCVYVALKCRHYQFYFTINKSDIVVQCPDQKIIRDILKQLPQNRPKVCILSAHGGKPGKNFMRLLNKHFELYKKIKYRGADAEYFRKKQVNTIGNDLSSTTAVPKRSLGR